MGSAGREYIPGKIHRSDRMAATGLYEDGKKGIRRLTDPELRIKDQDRDGVQAEVLYGVLGATGRLNDPEAAVEVMRIYNEWLAGLLRDASRSLRRAGRRSRTIRSTPRSPKWSAWRSAARCRGLDIANSSDLQAAVGSVLGAAVGGHQRDRAAAALPHGRRLRARPHPQDHVRSAAIRRARACPTRRRCRCPSRAPRSRPTSRTSRSTWRTSSPR